MGCSGEEDFPEKGRNFTHADGGGEFLVLCISCFQGVTSRIGGRCFTRGKPVRTRKVSTAWLAKLSAATEESFCKHNVYCRTVAGGCAEGRVGRLLLGHEEFSQ